MHYGFNACQAELIYGYQSRGTRTVYFANTVNPRYKHTVRRQGYMLISQDMLMSRLHVTGV
jgi:hypothetical protein